MFIINLDDIYIPSMRYNFKRFKKRGYQVRKKVDFVCFIISKANKEK